MVKKIKTKQNGETVRAKMWEGDDYVEVSMTEGMLERDNILARLEELLDESRIEVRD